MRYTLTSSDVQFDSWQIIQICIAFLKKTNKQKKQKNKFGISEIDSSQSLDM